MAAYHRVYDSRHLQADCQEPGSPPEPYARQSSVGYLFTVSVSPRTGQQQQSRCCRLAAVGADDRRYRLISGECGQCHVVSVYVGP